MTKSTNEKPLTEETTIDKTVAQKILSSVSYEKAFYFFTDVGKQTGATALDLSGFYEGLRVVEPQSVRFHFQRKDFQNWIKDVLGDPELAQKIDLIKTELSDQDLRNELLKTVSKRYTELLTASSSSRNENISEMGATASSGGLKEFNLEELKQFNGQAGKPAYFGFEGKVYDVTESSLWHNGDHMGAHKAAKDLTEAIKIAPHNKEVFNRIKQVGVLV